MRSIKTKGRAGGHQATRKTPTSNRDFTDHIPYIKGLVVTMVLWGLIPVGVAEWIIRRCRMGGAR